jgi:hypothetical protein
MKVLADTNVIPDVLLRLRYELRRGPRKPGLPEFPVGKRRRYFYIFTGRFNNVETLF